mgnify:CR=1 FL=1
MTKTRSQRFTLPGNRVATMPPEARGLRRDEVRLMVAAQRGISHTRFMDLSRHLRPGDLLVANSSPTMAAALAATMRGKPIKVHFSTMCDSETWTVELRRSDDAGPITDAVRKEVVRLDAGGWLRLDAPADGPASALARLWRASVSVPGGVAQAMQLAGEPIRYSYIEGSWPISAYQTIFATSRAWPGSAEMPSAGRPFSRRVVASLRRAGVEIATIQLHAGVSSQEAHEAPQPEQFSVPDSTVRAVRRAKAANRRVIAVGTTVTRALETAGRSGAVSAGSGWTNLVLGPNRPARIVDGLITGWHPPEASHLELLDAVAGPELVAAAYSAAIDGDYLWHEFGDSALFLPAAGKTSATAAA